MLEPILSQKHIIISKQDNQACEISQAVINSSELLKNICGLCKIADTIELDCSSAVLKILIELVENPEIYRDVDFKKELIKDFMDEKLHDFIKDICYLDSDVLIDVLADVILHRLQGLHWKSIQKYLKIVDDFYQAERVWIDNHRVEYLISLNSSSSPLKFPIPCESFCSLKSKLYSPMNVILARICERSDEATSFQLSQVCKTLKNECDRHPIKLSQLNINGNFCSMYLPNKLLGPIQPRNCIEILVKRKVIVKNDNIEVSFRDGTSEDFQKYLSLDFIIPQTTNFIKINFEHDESTFSYFDLQKCPFTALYLVIKGFKDGLKFNNFYEQIIAKDLSKNLEIMSYSFQFLHNNNPLTIYKKAGAPKFHLCLLSTEKILPEFLDFVKQYMEDDGKIISNRPISLFPTSLFIFDEDIEQRCYFVSDIKNYL